MAPGPSAPGAGRLLLDASSFLPARRPGFICLREISLTPGARFFLPPLERC
jgi:hypothetical protein